jgi:RNA polymerase sigma-70 factor (ECF subfamily)
MSTVTANTARLRERLEHPATSAVEVARRGRPDRGRSPSGRVSSVDAPDDVLWSAVLGERDRCAFAALFDRHGPVVHAFARRLGRSEEFGHDVTQEVFLRLWATPERFDPARGSVRAFLLQDCRSRSIDRIRAEDRLRARGRGWALGRGSSSASAEDIALEALHERGVRSQLEALPEVQREAMLLAFMDGHSYRSAAATLEVPEGTVKSRIRAGLQALHQELVTRAPGTPPSPPPHPLVPPHP